MRDNMGKVRPTICEIANSGISDILEAIKIGVPTDPKATGAVLAIKQIPAAYKGLKPRPTNMAPDIATCVSNPAAPSKKAPNENAINKACNLRSGVMEAIKFLITSNCPLLTVTLNKKTAEIMIQQIGNNPYNDPWSVDKAPANLKGIPYTRMAINNALPNASRLV